MKFPKKHTLELEQFYTKYKQSFYCIAYGVTNDEFLAEDAVSETFEKIIEDYEIFSTREEKKMFYYCLIIVRNTAIDIINRNKKHAKNSMLYMESKEYEKDILCGLDDEIIKKETVEGIKAQILKLNKIYCDVLILKAVYELSYKEIAKKFNVSESLIRKRYERGKRLLLENLKKEGIDCE